MSEKGVTLENKSNNPSVKKSVEKISQIEKLFFHQLRDVSSNQLEEKPFSRKICRGETLLSLEANKTTSVAGSALLLERS
ncbi:hypothetical protein [Chlamydiifrater phoenicopteri]|uniref:hypothetical protein n=1 Tax=Chlamydiifrater phoenicopteri TaxID=2681469 RepID=UPI001BCB1514|nr:hypothetical protein [Chlamydiifrater phoenicopteri]